MSEQEMTVSLPISDVLLILERLRREVPIMLRDKVTTDEDFQSLLSLRERILVNLRVTIEQAKHSNKNLRLPSTNEWQGIVDV